MPNSNNDEVKPLSRPKPPRQNVGRGTKRLKGRNKRDLDHLMDAEAREEAEQPQADDEYVYQGKHYPYTLKMPVAVAAVVTATFFGCAWKAHNTSPTHFWAPNEIWFWVALGITNATCVLLTFVFCPIGTPSISIEQDQENSRRRAARLMREWEYRNASPAERAAMTAMDVAPYLAASYVLKEMTDQVKADTARVDASLKRK